MKKLIIAVFVLSLVALPSTTRAGFFDFFRTNQSAQVKTAVKSDNLILQVQQTLTAQGFYKGDISGVVGSKTKTAIKAFQKTNGLTVTGLLDKVTVDAILKSGGPQGGNGFESRVCNSGMAPWIKVTSPNGGEVYQAGQQINVTWISCNVPATETVRIEFDSPFAGGGVANVFTPNTGSVAYQLPNSTSFPPLQYGNHYKVEMDFPALSVASDASNSNFSIIDGAVSCTVTTEQTNPFVSNVPSTNVAPFSASYTNLYNEMSVFRIQNPTNCPMTISKLSIVSTSTDGLEFVEKADLRLKTLDDGNVFSPTNIGPNYTDSNAYFTILDSIPANSYKDYSVGTSDIHYFDPYSGYLNMNWGGVAVGIGQVDFELPNLPLPIWNGNTYGPTTFGPIWGPVLTVQQ